jgi:hypothetical protein
VILPTNQEISMGQHPAFDSVAWVEADWGKRIIVLKIGGISLLFSSVPSTVVIWLISFVIVGPRIRQGSLCRGANWVSRSAHKTDTGHIVLVPSYFFLFFFFFAFHCFVHARSEWPDGEMIDSLVARSRNHAFAC